MDQAHLQEQIETIARHEQEFFEQRTSTERLGDSIASFAGSFPFVLLHVALFLVWVIFNALRVTAQWHFDPYPFAMLDTIVAMEAILLASFILMRQTRMGRRSDERDHLVLQILMLTERETTKLLEVNRDIAVRLGLQSIGHDSELAALSEETSIDDVAETIKETMQPEEL